MIVPEGTLWRRGRGKTAWQNSLDSRHLKTEKLVPYSCNPKLTDGVQHPLLELGQDLIDNSGSVHHLDQ